MVPTIGLKKKTDTDIEIQPIILTNMNKQILRLIRKMLLLPKLLNKLYYVGNIK